MKIALRIAVSAVGGAAFTGLTMWLLFKTMILLALVAFDVKWPADTYPLTKITTNARVDAGTLPLLCGHPRFDVAVLLPDRVSARLAGGVQLLR